MMRKTYRVLSGVLVTLALLSVLSVTPVFAKKPVYDDEVQVTSYSWTFKEGGKYNNVLTVKGTIETTDTISPIYITLYVEQIDINNGGSWEQTKVYDPEPRFNFGFKWWNFPAGWYEATVTVEYEGNVVWTNSFVFDPPGGGPGPMW